VRFKLKKSFRSRRRPGFYYHNADRANGIRGGAVRLVEAWWKTTSRLSGTRAGARLCCPRCWRRWARPMQIVLRWFSVDARTTSLAILDTGPVAIVSL
jgi:hypothetical protein